METELLRLHMGSWFPSKCSSSLTASPVACLIAFAQAWKQLQQPADLSTNASMEGGIKQAAVG